MDNQLNKRVTDLEKTISQTNKRLGKIEVLLTNHFNHLSSATTFWLKIITPSLVVITPMVVAFLSSQFAVDLLKAITVALAHHK